MASPRQINQVDQVASIPRLLEARADDTPNRPVIIAQERQPLSYRRLLLHAGEVVRRLNALGIGRNERVAVILPNGPEMASAFLTISSGASFAPLNPAYRAAEFDFFLSDLQAKAVIIQTGMDSPIVAVARRRSIPIIELSPIGGAEAGLFALKGEEQPPALGGDFAEPTDVALILHTSGTTSRPKMVALTHANLLASAGNITAALQLTEEDRCLSVMPLFHIHGLIGAVLSSVRSGSSVICAGDFSAPDFLDWLETLVPTWYTAVPTMHQAIVDRLQQTPLRKGGSSLRLIRSCSAPLPLKLLVELEDLFKVPVIEAYGMTEASHQIASNPLPPDRRKQGSVGVATGTEIAIMSEAGQFLSSRETGEIVLRGQNIIRGYEGAPAANREAFVDGWFRTGDLGYLDENGYLFITGRIKEIINRGGEKISPGEVDKVLMDHPAVAQALTFGVPHDRLGEDVAAAVVLKASASVTERDLQQFVSLRLADYKVPRHVVVVNEIPKGATGKLQRLGLAEKFGLTPSDRFEVRRRPEFAKPRAGTEEALAKIWEEVLGIERVGIYDNFFDLGGDSILASRVIARVRSALRAELSFLAFFDAPRLADMAATIDARDRDDANLPALSVFRASREGGSPLSFAQQRLWFFDQLEPKSPVYNRATLVRLTGQLDRHALQKAVTEIVRRHEAIRTTFLADDGRPRQMVSPTSDIAIAVVDLRDVPEASRETESRRLAIEESVRPFDLTCDLLLRVKLLQLGDEEYMLILTTHHIASDAWSDSILFHELSTLYPVYVAGLASPLPELPIQYGDFAAWQRASLQGAALQPHLDYWKRQLAGVPAALNLPLDRPRPLVRTFHGARHTRRLPESLSDDLKILSRQEDVTLYVLLLAAYQVLLGRYSRQHDIVVGTPIAGRTRLETENLIGVFINTLVLRTDLSGTPSFRSFLRRVREVFLEGYVHSDLPVEQLVEILQPERDMSRNPLFQVMFQLRNAPQPPLKLPNLEVEHLDFNMGLAMLDLTLEIVERDGGLDCWFHYNTDLFNGATIARMAEQYENLLEAFVADPDRRLCDLPLVLGPIENTCVTTEEIDDIYERSNLTSDQLLIWAGQKLQPETPLYNVPVVFHIAGNVDRRHFQRAFQTLLESSDALRTVIREIDGIPQQTALSDFPYEIEFRDFSNLPEPWTAVQAWLRSRSQSLIDFGKALFDCVLAKVTDRHYVWFLKLHHIIGDSRSIERIFRHVAQFYEHSVTGCLQRVELPAFKDYVEYEREYRRSLKAREVESYWKTKLAEPYEPLRFYGRQSIKTTTRIQKVECELGTDRTQKLRQLASNELISAKTEHASLFNLFAAALLTYLYRVTGSCSPSVGITFHNRRSAQFRDTIGLLMQVLPLRVSIEERDTFISLIRKIAAEAATAFKNSHSIANSPRKPVYDVLLNYDPLSFPEFNHFPVKMERVHSGHENDSLGLRIRDIAGGANFIIDFEFHRDVFGESDRCRAVQQFLAILDGLLGNPNQLLGEVSLLTEGERERILRGFSCNPFSGLDERYLPQLFTAQARDTPNHPAVVFENRALTYAQLDSKANQLAHYLRVSGVNPGTFVGVCVNRSFDMLIGLMGILKAGAAYVPLDPSYPKDRLALIVSDTRMPMLLSQQAVAVNLSEEHAAKVVYLDSEWTNISRMSCESPAVEVSANHPAYVIYTSGSTGIPKGVTVTHRALANFIRHAGETFALRPEDRVLQFASISFDTAVEEIFPCLIRGATLVLRNDAMLDSVSMFLETCRDRKVTVVDLPTAYWHELIETIVREKIPLPPTLRLFIIGGEAAIPERLAQWQRIVGDGIRLLNTYGPTEGTVVSTMCDLTERGPTGPTLHEVPIGRPISNIETYILDHRLNPAPIGVPGELHIGGAGLASGYLDRPELTAEKFIPHPFNNQPGARLYKSGDLARYLPDGNIEFLGRIDHQIKLRGFRIEPGEIEAVLRQHPAVRDALVMAREDVANDKRLVAYIVTERDGWAPAAELRDILRRGLPDYMVPSAFVFLDALPLSANGKVNRRELPAPDADRLRGETPFAAPVTPEQQIIAQIWAQVLHIDRVGIHDSFFDLGGHSLLGTQVVSRIREVFNVEMPLRVLFEHPTVAGLAVSIARCQAPEADNEEIVDIVSELESIAEEEVRRLVDHPGAKVGEG